MEDFRSMRNDRRQLGHHQLMSQVLPSADKQIKVRTDIINELNLIALHDDSGRLEFT